MPNTFVEFYKYLAETFICFFEKPGKLIAGERYSLFLEKEEDLVGFKQALLAERPALAHDFIYKHEQSSEHYHSTFLKLGETNLIIASDMGATENYLTTLRNLVSAQEGIFENTAILILFTGKLDSLLGGSGDLTKSGFPFNFNYFLDELRDFTKGNEALKSFEKVLLLDNLDNRKADARLENATIFDLAAVADIVNKGKIDIEDYHHLELFPYSAMNTFGDKEVESSIKDNHDLYTSVEKEINYGNLPTDLEKIFTPAGARLISGLVEDDKWQKIDLKEIMKARKKRTKAEPAEYLGLDEDRLPPTILPWDLPLENNKAGQRTRSILIFNTSKKEEYQVFLSFNMPLKGKLTIHNPLGTATQAEIIKKAIRISIASEHYNEQFLDLEYEDENTTYRFRIWALNCSAAFMKSFNKSFQVLENGSLSLNSLNKIIFNPEQDEIVSHEIFSGDEVEITQAQHHIDFAPSEEGDEIAFTATYGDYKFKFKALKKVKTPGPITGWGVWQEKRVHGKHFGYEYDELKDILKLTLKSAEYVVRDDYRKNLLLERQMMQLPSFAWTMAEDLTLSVSTLNLSLELTEAYNNFYYAIHSVKDLLPSLAYLGGSLKNLAEAYVQQFMAEIDQIPEEIPLSPSKHADLLKIGTIYDSKSGDVAFTPFHPLNIAFQLEINEQLGQSVLYEAMLKKFNTVNLMPYLSWKANGRHTEELYCSRENATSPEWVYYGNDNQSQQIGGKQYVRRLVNKKIAEFVENFEFLFAIDNRAPIKINVFHMGDCSQVLQGIFDYYKDEVAKKVNPKDLRPVDLHIDGSDQYVTMFEKMAHLYNTQDIEDTFELSSNLKSFSMDDLLNAFRTNVRFFAYGDEADIKYAHLSFYKLNNAQNAKSRRSSNQLVSGLSLNGLIADLPSNHIGNQYVTAFGTKFNTATNLLSRMSAACNALAVVHATTHPYSKGESICTLLDDKLKLNLDNLYSRSQWVTFVDPHFDHSFFKGEDDIIIVHYSDQYSNASGFDAITVTKKSGQYEYLLNELLKRRGVVAKGNQVPKLIDLYNAVNGEWLLKLIGKKNTTIQMEKLSIASAIKGFLALYAHPDIIWVPLSLEEILRVSSGAGLDKSSGLFSTKNLGAVKEHSDDLLMVGLFEFEGKLNLQFYPLEVKIGENNSGVIAHAKSQVKKTYKLLYDHLNGEEPDFRQSFYRNFFSKLILISAGKMDFYNIWPEQNWEKVHTLHREALMSNQFEVSDQLDPYIGKYAIFAFTEGEHLRTIVEKEDLMVFNLLQNDGYSWLIADVEEHKEWVRGQEYTIEADQLLYARLEKVDDLKYPVPEWLAEQKKKTNDLTLEGQVNIDLPKVTPSTIDNQQKGEISIEFGAEVNNRAKIFWKPGDTSKVMHTNTGIIGTMGTGKTQFTKSVVTQLSQSATNNVDQKPIGILIFDYKGDYLDQPFVQATGAKVYQLHNLPYNPLAIDVSEHSMPLLPLHIASTLQETISNAFNLGNKQKALLKETIMAAYAEKGIYKNQPETWSNTPPTISDVCELYLSDEKAAIDSLHAALNQLHDFEIFQPDGSKTQSLYDLIDGVTVIKLSGYSADIQNLVVAITLDAFYSQMQKNGHSKIDGHYRQLSKIVLVDEADNFLSKNFLSLRKILKEGREFGVGTILSTQFLNHFSTGENEYDQYILTWIIHRVNDVKIKDIDSLFSVKDKERKEKLIQTIKNLQKHQSLVSLGGAVPVVIEDLPFYKLIDQ